MPALALSIATVITCTPQLEFHDDEAEHSQPYGSRNGWHELAILHRAMVQFFDIDIDIAIAIAIAIAIDLTFHSPVFSNGPNRSLESIGLLLSLSLLWTSEKPVTVCSTLSSGRPYSARVFMARCLRPYNPLCSGGEMSMKICGRAGATGSAQVGARQGCKI